MSGDRPPHLDTDDDSAVEQLVCGFAGMVESVAGANSLSARWHELCRATTDLLRCDRSSILLRHGAVFRTEANHGDPAETDARFRGVVLDADDPLVEEVRQRRQVVVVEETRSSPLITAAVAPAEGLAVAPMWNRHGHLVGMVTAEYDQHPVSLRQVHRELLGGLAHLASILAEQASDAAGSASERVGDAGVLSPREMELFELLCRGCTNEEAAAQLHRSVRTIEAHRGQIMKKLGATTRADMMAAAVDLGVIQFRGSPSSTNRQDVAADPTEHSPRGTRCIELKSQA